MKPKLIALATLSLLLSVHVFAQKKKKVSVPNRVACEYGDVKPEDFATAFYSIDSSAEAVYLFNGGNSLVTASTATGWEVRRKVHVKIRLLNKNAFGLGTVKFYMYSTPKFKQGLDDLKATTYNISNGTVVPAELNKNDIFQERVNDKYVAVKFTFPNMTEGSIIEYSYSISTPSPNNLDGWEFQKRYPVLLSDYEINYPSLFNYALIKKGYLPYMIDTVTVKGANYLYHQETGEGISKNTQSLSIACQAVDCIWVIKDLPAVKQEPFITALDNYTSSVDFQLSSIRYSEDDVINYLRSWNGVADTIIREDYYLGKAFVVANGFLDDDVKKATEGAADNLDRAKKIYAWVRDNYTATETRKWMEQPLKKVYQSKKGSSAEINAILLTMLKNAGLTAYPVLLSTTENGKATRDYPVLEQYNDVICAVMIDDKTYLLDASNSRLGFNHLQRECYNGYARVINPANAQLLNLSSDSLKENALTSVFISNDGNGLSGNVADTKGYQESLLLRDEIARSGKDAYFKRLKKSYTDNIVVDDVSVDSLTKLDDPVRVGYRIKMENGSDDIIYFNPLLANRTKENPFAAAERYYPVEMPYCKDETYVLNMEIPTGYVVDELPKSTRVKLNDNEGMFEYIIAKSDDRIQLRTRIKLEKATYEPEDYQTLRDFFAFIVKKEEEQIVFKKK